jgi:hypothetical protein
MRIPAPLHSLVVLTLCAREGMAEPPGRAFFLDEDLTRLRARIESSSWARRAWREVLSAAEAWVESPAAIPDGPTGSYHDYFCPDHGLPLKHDPRRPREHLCPKDGFVFRGPKLDAYWVTATLRHQLQAAVRCGLAWRITGEERYARAGAAVLLGFAERYRERIAARAPPRWMAQSLDEATLVLDGLRAYELLRGSPALTPEKDRQAAAGWLLPTARFLRGERRAIHNIDCWFNAAILAAGAVTGEPDLVEFALGGTPASRHGLRDQLREGVSREGFWREGSTGYHYYALAAILETLEAARGLGVDLARERETARAMLLAPLALADGELVIPPTNDSQPASLERFLDQYEMGAALFPEDPLLAGFLAEAYRRSGRPRSGLTALLYGPEPLADLPVPWPSSRSFPDTGLAVLRTRSPHPPGGEVYALIDFGPHGGTHGHPDKLSVSLSALRRVLSPDTGTAGYGLPLNGSWYRQTLSHNSLVVDRRSQRPATGKLLSFQGEGPLQSVVASAGEAYPGVDWTRGLFLAEEGFLVVLDRLSAQGGERLVDWVWHGYGDLVVTSPLLEPLTDRAAFGEGDGYQVVQGLRRGTVSRAVEAAWRIRGDTPTQPAGKSPGTAGSLRIRLLVDAEAQVFQGTAPGNPAADSLPLLLVRLRGKELFIRAVLEPVPEGAEPSVSALEPIPGGLQVSTRRGERRAALP